jgi:hypothetical protein
VRPQVFSVDPVAISREVCRRYLEFRRVPNPTESTVPDLAVNIHSWSECTMQEVTGWLDLLERHSVRRIFIVPHNPTLGVWSEELGGGCGPSYRGELEARGYVEAASWTGPPCQPRTYFLFQRPHE